MTPPDGFTQAFRALDSVSFADFLDRVSPASTPRHGSSQDLGAVHGTTIVALRCAGGVVMAGDRRATMGNYIAQKDIELAELGLEQFRAALAARVKNLSWKILIPLSLFTLLLTGAMMKLPLLLK